ncbi:hypothetical protein [Nitrososphaeria virus YSH_462411]|uniref:Uncharacterized protein n=1 Tax=Nitrososphaeria virus YSH_462411 TaxID=3071321 RepID=A0A976UAG5_9CAUD|nr:hypothetical protein QKV92_gp24 [Yangshan Harbor Nitrososphaeria virus]UVF62296.1 hypothetical protein [Nitrososphaeria virus YSH_462411]
MKIDNEVLDGLEMEDSSFEHVEWKNHVRKQIISNQDKLQQLKELMLRSDEFEGEPHYQHIKEIIDEK